MSVYAVFLFDNCALGARLCYGTTSYFVVMSAFLIGYRQICIANTIQSIVQTGDLINER